MDDIMEKFLGEEAENTQEQEVVNESVEETVQEPVEETVSEEVVSEEPHEGSVESDVEDTAIEEPTLTDESVLNYLKEKGVEVDSFDSLTNNKQEEEEVFANEYIKGYNEFARKTGRSIDEYNFVQADLSETPEQELIVQKLKMDNPQLSDRQVNLLFNNQYKKIEIDEDFMSDEEIATAKEANELVDIKMQQDGRVARSTFLDLQEQYKLPEQKTEESQGDVFDSEGFKESFMAEADSIERISFDIGNDKTFDYVIEEGSTVDPVTPDEFLSRYINEDGSYNQELFASHVIALRDMDKIVAAAASSQRSEGKEEVVRDLKNVNLEPSENNVKQNDSGLAELARMMNQF